MKKGVVTFPTDIELSGNFIVSRFLAKIAIEAMAQRIIDSPGGIDYIVDEKQLDLIRNHARLGNTKEWPVSIRRIYEQDKKWKDNSDSIVQLVHEFDILVTESSECYFILVLFGLELTINYGGPEIEGYENWLKEHKDISPLYLGKNVDTSGLIEE